MDQINIIVRGVTPLNDAPSSGPTALAVGAKVGFIGDSILAHNHNSGPIDNEIRSLACGELLNAHMRDPRWRMETWHDPADANGRDFTGANHGVSGDTTTGVLARLAAFIAMEPDIAVLAVGTNNLSPTATCISEFESICDALLAQSIKVVACTVRPWSTAKSGDNPTSRANRNTVNTGIRDYAATKSSDELKLCDFDLAYDADEDDYGPVDWYDDGLHPNDLGASSVGAFLGNIIGQFIEPGNWLTSFWSIGNLQQNPTFTGTTGNTSTGCTGTLADDYKIKRASGSSTAALSLEANAETGGQSIVIDITPIGANTNERFEMEIGNTGEIAASVGDEWVASWIELEYDDKAWMGLPQLQVFHGTQGAADFSLGGYNSSTPIDMAPANGRLWLMTPPILMPAGTQSFISTIQIRLNPANGIAAGDGPARVKIHRWWTGVIENPIALWS